MIKHKELIRELKEHCHAHQAALVQHDCDCQHCSNTSEACSNHTLVQRICRWQMASNTLQHSSWL